MNATLFCNEGFMRPFVPADVGLGVSDVPGILLFTLIRRFVS